MSAQSKIVIIVLLLSSLFFVIITGAQEAGLNQSLFIKEEQAQAQAQVSSKKVPQKIDRNNNKIFDELDDIIAPKNDDDFVDVIVLLNETSSKTVRDSLKANHGEFTEKLLFHSINGFATTLTKGQIISLANSPKVKHIEFDALVFPHLDTSQQWFGTAKARTDFSLDGNADGSASYSKDDVVIAILDTGIDPNHLDLDDGKIIGWRDSTINNDQSGPYDELGACSGHGTHVSSIAAGDGEADSTLKGVAPGAALVGVKVLSLRTIQGQTYCTAATSEIVAGVQWIIDYKSTYGINVGNMSLGASGCSDGTGSLSTIVDSAVNAGIVMTVSAGNEGPGTCTIGEPSASDKAITVGAMADVFPGAAGTFGCGFAPGYGFYLICFSSRGLTADGRIKPDIASAGVFIKAAQAGTTNGYKVMSGTSMSSPFTAGVAALMLHANSSLSPAQIKQIISNTALDLGPAGKDKEYGAGRLQAYEAIKAAGSLTGTGPSVPSHMYIDDSLGGSNKNDYWNFTVTDTSLPIAITLIMPNWTGFRTPDFDVELIDPDGIVVANSISATRQETIGFLPTKTGIYQVHVYIYRGSGDYFFDVSYGQAVVSIILTTDGTTPFGIQPLGSVIDTTATGTADVQTIQVIAGPADLNVKSSLFSDGSNSWDLGTSGGVDQVKWEFSPQGTTWNTFDTPNTLFSLASNVAATGTQDVFFRLTLPTDSSSSLEHSAVVTIVATAP